MIVAPGATYESVLEAGIPGLVGTVAVGLLDNQGGETEALSTDAIVETPAGSGVYAATRTAPADAGQYTILWSLDGTTAPDQVAIDELVVSFTAPGDLPVGPYYGTVEELASILHVGVSGNEDGLTRVLVTASGEVDSEIAVADPLSGWQLALATEVTLERAVEHWRQMKSPFGIIAIGAEPGASYTARDSWDRHAHKLAPLKATWGLA